MFENKEVTRKGIATAAAKKIELNNFVEFVYFLILIPIPMEALCKEQIETKSRTTRKIIIENFLLFFKTKIGHFRVVCYVSGVYRNTFSVTTIQQNKKRCIKKIETIGRYLLFGM